MKSLILSTIAISILILPGSLFAEEEWEKNFVGKGWENVTRNDFSDTTWYGKQTSENQKNEERIVYIYPNGKNLIYLHVKNGIRQKEIWRGTWKISSDNKICVNMSVNVRNWNVCGITIWKDNDNYYWVTLIGYVMTIYNIQKGNLEKFNL